MVWRTTFYFHRVHVEMMQFDLRICFKWVGLENSCCNINFHQLETPKTRYFQLPHKKWYKFLCFPGSIRFSLVNLWIIIILLIIININNIINNSSNPCPKCRLKCLLPGFSWCFPRCSMRPSIGLKLPITWIDLFKVIVGWWHVHPYSAHRVVKGGGSKGRGFPKVH